MRAPYSFLVKTIRVLAVDSDKKVLDGYREQFSACCLFDLRCVNSAHKAEELLEEGARWHVCLYGLGTRDAQKDPFALLREHGKSTAFLVVDDTGDPRTGYKAGTYGAKGFLRKPADLEMETLLSTTQRAFLHNIVNPDSSFERPFVRRATGVLIGAGPRSVSQWARELGVSESYLRKAWTDAFDYQLKHILFLYHLFCSALAYYDVVYTLADGNTTAVMAKSDYAQRYEYWSANKKALLKILT